MPDRHCMIHCGNVFAWNRLHRFLFWRKRFSRRRAAACRAYPRCTSGRASTILYFRNRTGILQKSTDTSLVLLSWSDSVHSPEVRGINVSWGTDAAGNQLGCFLRPLHINAPGNKLLRRPQGSQVNFARCGNSSSPFQFKPSFFPEQKENVDTKKISVDLPFCQLRNGFFREKLAIKQFGAEERWIFAGFPKVNFADGSGNPEISVSAIGPESNAGLFDLWWNTGESIPDYSQVYRSVENL